MALRFIYGGSGSGKTTYLRQKICSEAMAHPTISYIVLVPDQFTLETQRMYVESTKGHGILNIDILSFHRLAYRAFEEMPGLRRTVLDDVGKTMILRRVFTEQKDNLRYFKRGIMGAGFLDECKSFLCELAGYAVSEDDLTELIDKVGDESLMAMKLMDIRLIYHAFTEKMGDTYMMAEELVPQLTKVVSELTMMRDSVVCMDGFTGFTPTQYDLISELMIVCKDVYVTVTTDRTDRRDAVFAISRDTIRRLNKLAKERYVEIEEPVYTGEGPDKIPYRVALDPELSYLEEYLFAYGMRPWQDVPKHISITKCQSERGEAAYVARRIWWLVHEGGYHYEDIAVVTAGLSAYTQPLSRELEKLSIPYFMDDTRNIGANAMAEYIMSFIQMVEKGMDYETVFRFLRCGLSPLSPEETDQLENYVIARGIRGYKAYHSEWSYTVNHIDLVQVNEYRQHFVSSIEETVLALKGGKKTVKEYTTILYQIIVNNHIYERLQEKSKYFEEKGEDILAREYKRIYRLVMDLFDEMVGLLGDEIVTLREYREILGSGISEGLVGFIPPTSHQVVVGDVIRTRLPQIKVLIFVGVNDDSIPKAKGTPGILSESERRKIEEAGVELAPDAEEESYTEQFYLYLALTKASEQVILTYATTGADGTSKRPAYLIRQMKGLYPGLTVHDESDHPMEAILGSDCGRSYLIRHLADRDYKGDMAFMQIASYYEQREPGYLSRLADMRRMWGKKSPLKKEVAERLYGRVLGGSVTRFEQFVKCPYAHFIRYGLSLDEREEYQIRDLDHGNIFHQAMEHFSHRLEQEGKEWQDLSEAEAKTIAEDCVDYAVERYEGRKYLASGRTRFMTHRIKNELVNSVWAMWCQMKEGDFHQLYTEKTFYGRGEESLRSLCIPLDEGRQINLRGVIDRVDICHDIEGAMVKIVDYKSSDSVDLSLSQVYYGLQMQLVTYMAAADELVRRDYPDVRTIPAAMLYYTLKEKDLEWKEESESERRDRALKSMRCKGMINKDISVVEHLDHSLVNGGELVATASSPYFPVETDKEGDYTKRSHVIDSDQFVALMHHTRQIMTDCGNEILDGKISVSPYNMEGRDACEYCPYRPICGREEKMGKRGRRDMKKMTDDEVWEALDGRD